MISSLEEKAGPSICTVMPRLVLRMGRSPFKPTTGFMKHHAGTTPISMLFGGSGLNKDLGCMNALPSLPTTHHPSSNDWTTVSLSPRLTSSSSGSMGLKIWRIFRRVPVVGFESIEEVEDRTEKRLLPEPEALKNEIQDPRLPPDGGRGPPSLLALSAKEKGWATMDGLGKLPDWR